MRTLDLAQGPDSHFYSAEKFECDILSQLEAQAPFGQRAWRFERNAFRVTVPTGGACPTNLTPIHRLYNGATRGKDPNHRYVSSSALNDAMQAIA